MPKFKVEISEILVRHIEIEADYPEEAADKAEEMDQAEFEKHKIVAVDRIVSWVDPLPVNLPLL